MIFVHDLSAWARLVDKFTSRWSLSAWLKTLTQVCLRLPGKQQPAEHTLDPLAISLPWHKTNLEWKKTSVTQEIWQDVVCNSGAPTAPGRALS